MNSLSLTLSDCRAIAENHAIASDQELELATSEDGSPIIQRASWNGHQMEVLSEGEAQAGREKIVNAFADTLKSAGLADFFPQADEFAAMEHGLTRGCMKQVLDRVDRATVKATVVKDDDEPELIVNHDHPVLAEPIQNSSLRYDEILGEDYEPYQASPPTVDAVSYQTVDISPNDLVSYYRKKIDITTRMGRSDVAAHWEAALREAQEAVRYRQQAVQESQQGNQNAADLCTMIAQEQQSAARCYEKVAKATRDGKKEVANRWIVAGGTAKAVVFYQKDALEQIKLHQHAGANRSLHLAVFNCFNDAARVSHTGVECRIKSAHFLSEILKNSSHDDPILNQKIADTWSEAARAMEDAAVWHCQAAESRRDGKDEELIRCKQSIAAAHEVVADAKKEIALALQGKNNHLANLWDQAAHANEKIADCRKKILEAALAWDGHLLENWNYIAERWSTIADAQRKLIEATEKNDQSEVVRWTHIIDDAFARLESLTKTLSLVRAQP